MKVLSYNIQAAINTSSYWSYSYQWYRQFLPNPGKRKVLSQIADFISDYDVVCLQEVELGGLRNGFESQRSQLLEMTNFPYDMVQVNRRISQISLHGNLILSKLPLKMIANQPIPGKIKGRGFLAAAVEYNGQVLVITDVHLSLGKEDQLAQIKFIDKILSDYDNVLVCGDFNSVAHSKAIHYLQKDNFERLGPHEATFPSWKPKKCIDHMLLKGSFKANATVCDVRLSDHLPIAAQFIR